MVKAEVMGRGRKVSKQDRKPSRQQTIVAAAVLHRDDHPTAEMVLETARRIDPRISLATVYRNLERMVDDSLIGKVTMSDGADRYDPNMTEHIHAVCDRCGRIFDITTDLTIKAREDVDDETDFQSCGCEITVYGLCKRCQRKRGKEA
jgi:Fur family peroxide stress response transcriptional regulator